MMQRRAIGRTGIELSVVGAGTAQLQMLPERQAIDTLVRAFELGVNWVHTAPDYGGVERWIAKAIETSGRDVMVLAQSTALRSELEAFFESTCHLFKRRRLALYGINCIEDIEHIGENVWGRGGMIEYLQRKKAEGRLGGIFCTTHGSARYVETLIESGVFDALMVAYNPLGFHLLTHFSARVKAGRHFENLAEYRDRIFPLAAKRGVALLIMKPLAGGLLCRGRGLPPFQWYASENATVAAADVLKLILQESGVAAVLPGMSSVDEAEENARAGYGPLTISAEAGASIARAVETMRLSLCSRCGDCEPTCSRSLPIPAMFRDVYIWSTRNETFMASDDENYFHLHPDDVLACATCTDQSCRCPQGIQIPAALARVHAGVHALRAEAQHPGPLSTLRESAIEGSHRLLVLTRELPSVVDAGAAAVGRFLVQNVGDTMWTAYSHAPDPRAAVAIGIVIGGRLVAQAPLRNNVCPSERSMLVFEFRAPHSAGDYSVSFVLMPMSGRDARDGTVFHSAQLRVEPNGNGSSAWRAPQFPSRAVGVVRNRLGKVRRFAGRSLRRSRPEVVTGATESVYGVTWLEHSIPSHLEAGATYGVRVALENAGSLTWCANPAAGSPVDLFVLIDDGLVAILKLPVPEVPRGERVTIHFALRGPATTGPHQVRVELVHDRVAWFSNRSAPPLVVPVEVGPARETASARSQALALKHNLWHYLPTQGIRESRDGRALPLFVSRAKGCRLWDPEGHEFLDYTMGWGSTILGHADDRVQAAIRDVLDTAPLTPFPHPIEMEVSGMLAEDFPSAEMVVFGKNGSDVCTVAARLARGITGRRVILSCGFHGWQDFALEYFSFADSGIPDRPERYLHKFRFNDPDSFFDLYNQHKDDLAAVMIEPSGPWVDDETGVAPDADPEFLRTIADAARRVKALVIFDEIVTGYRYPRHSVQGATGVVPDLTCLGKALASGMPLSALVGPAHFFFDGFAKTHYCPTFRAEMYSLAAARAAIGIYRTEPVAEHIWRYGEALRAGIHDLCEEAGVAGTCTGPPFRMGFVFGEKDPMRRQLKRTLLVQELLKQGIVTATGVMLPSYAHTDRTREQTLTAFRHALAVVAGAERGNALHRFIEIPLL